MNDSPTNNNGSNNNGTPNWLGFSLSPHMKMEDPHHHNVPTSFFISSSYGENGVFHSPLSVMPLKSDGSLCIMEALSRSQQSEGKNISFSLFVILYILSNTFLKLTHYFVYLFKGWCQVLPQNLRTF